MDRCGKNDEKITPYCHPLYAKSQICIEIAKIEKLKTLPLSKVIIDQGHVLGNANFDPGKQICVFASVCQYVCVIPMGREFHLLHLVQLPWVFFGTGFIDVFSAGQHCIQGQAAPH